MLVFEAQFRRAVAGRFRHGLPAAAFLRLFLGCFLGCAARLGGGAASQIVGKAAGMRADLAVAFEGQDGGHRAVEEIAVVTDNQDGAVIFGDHLLKQVKCLHVEIIRRLVQDQEIMRLGEQLRQQQPVLLAPRQGRHLLRHLVVVEQEVAKIGGDMAGRAGHLDHVAAAAGQHCPGRGVSVKCAALLVEIGRQEAKSLSHPPAIRFVQSQKHLHQRRFANAVRPDNADPVAAPHQHVEMVQKLAARFLVTGLGFCQWD